MNLLYLLDEWPEPANSGAKVHDKIMLRCLRQDWHAEVACWTESFEREKKIHESCTKILVRQRTSISTIFPSLFKLLLKGVPIHEGEFLSKQSRYDLQDLIASSRPEVIVISSPRLAVIVPFLKSISPAKIIVDTHDVHVQRCKSIYDALSPIDVVERIKQLLLIRSYGIVEKKIYRQIDVAWALKLEDKQLLSSFGSAPQVDVVPNVVDPDMIRDISGYLAHSQPGPLTAVFIGDYSYKPNEQCALALVEWFTLQKIKVTETRLYLIGVNPTGEMKRMAKQHRHIDVTGSIDDLAEFYIPIDTLFLAPLLAGGGVKRKVIEAMALGCPVITTEVGAEGLALEDGSTAVVCSISNFPDKIVEMATDREMRMRLAKNAQRHINSNFGYNTLRRLVRSSIESLDGEYPRNNEK